MSKDQILREIRRTAAKNGGTPLGWRRFAAETGIREADWLGKFWDRWGDALQEAGLQRNQLQAAYETADLLERYAVLAEHLERLPTANDLRMQDRIEPGFPNQKVFERLGTKAELVQMVRAHCKAKGSHSTVVAMCEAYVVSPRRDKVDGSTPSVGFVYLIKSGRFYKIGRSNSMGRREYEVALQLPDKISTVHSIRTDDPVGIEAYWHQRFAEKRRNGEWFSLDAVDVMAFKRRRFM